MVRETRHLWVGNLPENIREERIREHFKRYGRVQSVKLLPRHKEDTHDGSSGLCATVAFMDIKSASKAHLTEHKIDERVLSTEYYEPAAIPGGSAGSGQLYSPAPPTRFPHGPPEELPTFERSSHFYERGGRSGDADAYLRRSAASYHVPGEQVARGRPRDRDRDRDRERTYRNGPYAPMLERAQPAHHRSIASCWSSYDSASSARYQTQAAPTPDPYPEEPSTRRETQQVVVLKKKRSAKSRWVSSTRRARLRTRSGSESGSNSGSSRSRSRSPSHSSSTSSQSVSSSCSSASSSPASEKSCSPHSQHGGARSGGRLSTVQSTVSTPIQTSANPSVHSDDARPLAICVRNLPIRSSDTSLKDGLFHEYKKHGKVTWVKVVGQGGDRYALVCFKKPEDAEKALEVSHDKLFFGHKIQVAPCQGYDVEDNEFRPFEAELNEYHPKATRTLFIGNLEKDVTAQELKKHFEQFGEIIEIDIKKQGGVSSYAFCQFADIGSVVKAMRSLDGENLGQNRIKLGFGKSMHTTSVWVGGLADSVSEKYLTLQFSQFGPVTQVTIDRERGHALVFFEQLPFAQMAVKEMRGLVIRGRKLQVDFASRECQDAFFAHLDKSNPTGERVWDRRETQFETRWVATSPKHVHTREVSSSRFESTGLVPATRFSRYDSTPQRTRTSSYTRSTTPAAGGGNVTPSGASTPVGVVRVVPRTPRSSQRYDMYDGTFSSELCEKRYRSYDEFSQGSGGAASVHSDGYEGSPSLCGTGAVVAASGGSGGLASTSESDYSKRLQSVVVSEACTPHHHSHPPQDQLRHLHKERLHLQHQLEQLDDGNSSADEATVPRKRIRVDDNEVLVDSLHNHRRVSDSRRSSDAGKHCGRRQSTDSATKHCVYSPHPVCKRRKTGSSVSEGDERRHHHHHHHSNNDVTVLSGNESGDNSRPGTPLCDERPENLLPPSEPRRIPRERLSSDGPISLPLPRFAAQMQFPTRSSVSTSTSVATSTPGKSCMASPPAVTSPKAVAASSMLRVPSPTAVPPPASPPPRPPSLPSPSSSDSEISPPSPTLAERVKALDEMFEKWSGSRTLCNQSGEAVSKVTERLRSKHKLLDLDFNEIQPSDIVKSVLAKRSVFDEDSKRLENVSDKYEPKEFVPVMRSRTGSLVDPLQTKASTSPFHSSASLPTTPSTLSKFSSPLHSPSLTAVKSPFSSGASTPSATTKPAPAAPSAAPMQSPKLSLPMPKTAGAVSPRPTTPGSTASGSPMGQGLQYPFPSHPPVQPTTSVATTTAGSLLSVVTVSSSIADAPRTSVPVSPDTVRLKCVTVPTTAVGTVISSGVTACVTGTDPRLTKSPPAASPSASTASPPSAAQALSPSSVLASPETTRGMHSHPHGPAFTESSPKSSSVCTSSIPPRQTIKNIPPQKAPSEVCVSDSVSDSPRSVITPSTVPSVMTSSPSVVSVSSVNIPLTSTVPSQDVPKSRKESSKPCIKKEQSSPTLSPKEKVAETPSKCSTPARRESASSSSSSASSCGTKKDSDADSHKSYKVKTEERRSCTAPAPVESRRESEQDDRKRDKNFKREVEAVDKERKKDREAESQRRKERESIDSADKDRPNRHTERKEERRKERKDAADKRKDSTEHRSVERRKKDDASELEHERYVEALFQCTFDEQKDDKKKDADRRHAERKEERRKEERRKDSTEKRKDSTENRPVDRRKKDDASDLEHERYVEALFQCTFEEQKDDRKKDADRRHAERKEERRKEERRKESTEKRKDSTENRSVERRKKEEKREVSVEELEDTEDNDMYTLEKDQEAKKKEAERRKAADRIREQDRQKEADKEKQLKRQKEREERKKEEKSEKRHSSDSSASRRKEGEQSERDAETGDSDRKHSEVKRRETAESEWAQDLMDTLPERKRDAQYEVKASDVLDRRREETSASQSDRKKESVVEASSPLDRRREDPRHHSEKKDVDSHSDNRRHQPESQAERRHSSDKPKEKPLSDSHKESLDRRKDGETENDLERRRERAASIGGKRRISSQDSVDSTPEEAKRLKVTSELSNVPERRDSKDSGRSSGSSKRSSNERYVNSTEVKLDKQKKLRIPSESLPCKEDVDSEDDIKEMKMMSPEFGSTESLDDKGKAIKKDKHEQGKKRKELTRRRENFLTGTDTDGSDDDDKPKKHSIFDIVDDGPAYISMYDKVKARSTKNMQKQEEEKRKEKMEEKFSALKTLRAKREEKKRSTSWDEDSDSESGRGKNSRRKTVITSSSEDDNKTSKSKSKKEETGDSESDSRVKRVSMSDDGLTRNRTSSGRSKPGFHTSEDEHPPTHRLVHRSKGKAQIYSDDSEVDMGFAGSADEHAVSKNRSFQPIRDTTDEETDEPARRRMFQPIRDTTDEETDLPESSKRRVFLPLRETTDEEVSIDGPYKIAVFTTEDEEELTPWECDAAKNKLLDSLKLEKRGCTSKHGQDENLVPNSTPPPPTLENCNSIHSKNKTDPFRKKSHKKKQKKKNSQDASPDATDKTDLTNSEKKLKKHSSKKERRKSSHSKSVDGDDEEKAKIRRKKMEKIENNIKRDDKMENIFGPLSEDSENSKPAPPVKTNNRFDKSKWQVNEIYGSDDYLSDEKSRRDVRIAEFRERKEKKRRERKALDEAGRALEAKLVASENPSPTKTDALCKPETPPSKADANSTKTEVQSSSENTSATTPSNDFDVFRFTEGDESRESEVGTVLDKTKEKRKKRKKSKEEKQNRHHHHHKELFGDYESRKPAPEENDLANATNKVEVEEKKKHSIDQDTHCERQSDLEVGSKEPKLSSSELKSEEEKLASPNPPVQSPNYKSVTVLTTKTDPKVNHEQPETPEVKVQDPSDSLKSPVHHSLSPESPEHKRPLSPDRKHLEEPKPLLSATLSPVNNKKVVIPGFGKEIDETIHETAVKSIELLEPSKVEVVGSPQPSNIKAEPVIKAEAEEEKAIISQEETEDAVAALLEETFGPDFGGYGNENDSGGNEQTDVGAPSVIDDECLKSDTPQSEPDLQIDTDTEDADRSLTPPGYDIRSSSEAKSNVPEPVSEGLEERICDIARSRSPPLLVKMGHGDSREPLKVQEPVLNASETPKLESVLKSGPPRLVPTKLILENSQVEAPRKSERPTPMESLKGDLPRLDAHQLEIPKRDVPPAERLKSSVNKAVITPSAEKSKLDMPSLEPKMDTKLEPRKPDFSGITSQSDLKHVVPSVISAHKQDQRIIYQRPVIVNMAPDDKKPAEYATPFSAMNNLDEKQVPDVKASKEDNTIMKSPVIKGSVIPPMLKQYVKTALTSLPPPILKAMPPDTTLMLLANVKPNAAPMPALTPTQPTPQRGAMLTQPTAPIIRTNIVQARPVLSQQQHMGVTSPTRPPKAVCFASASPKVVNNKITQIPAATTTTNYVNRIVSSVAPPAQPTLVPVSTSSITGVALPSSVVTSAENSITPVASVSASATTPAEAVTAAAVSSSLYGSKDDQETGFMSPKREDTSRDSDRDDDEGALCIVEDDVIKKDTGNITSRNIRSNIEEDHIKLDSPIDAKDESDFWSAKEVNIDSVIKKVEAICSNDEMEARKNNKPWMNKLEAEKSPWTMAPVKEDSRTWLSNFPGTTSEKEAAKTPKSWMATAPVASDPVPTKEWPEAKVPEKIDGAKPVKPDADAEAEAADAERRTWLETKTLDQLNSAASKEKERWNLQSFAGGVSDEDERSWVPSGEQRWTPQKEVQIKNEPTENSVEVPPPVLKDDKVKVEPEVEDHPKTPPPLTPQVVRATPEAEAKTPSSGEVSKEEVESPELVEETDTDKPDDRTDNRRRGRGGRRGARSDRGSGVTTRRTRNQPEAATPPTVTTRSSRTRGKGSAGGMFMRKLDDDVYEFRDDSDDEGAKATAPPPLPPPPPPVAPVEREKEEPEEKREEKEEKEKEEEKKPVAIKEKEPDKDKGNRPRLILTIKSPCVVTAASASATITTASTVVVETREEMAPCATTRKSRRLQEKDGSRSTIDDVIEDVVRNANVVTRSAASAENAKNAAAAAAAISQLAPALPPATTAPPTTVAPSVGPAVPAVVAPQPTVVPTRRLTRQANRGAAQPETGDVRKSPRAGRKGVASRRTSTSETRDSSEDRKKSVETSEPPKVAPMVPATVPPPVLPPVLPPVPSLAAVSAPLTPVVVETPTKAPGKLSTRVLEKEQKEQKEREERQRREKKEPLMIIDPVSGLLIPMTESEEGQYIPVSNSGSDVKVELPQELQIPKLASTSETTPPIVAPVTALPSTSTPGLVPTAPAWQGAVRQGVTAPPKLQIKAHVLQQTVKQDAKVQAQVAYSQAPAKGIMIGKVPGVVLEHPPGVGPKVIGNVTSTAKVCVVQPGTKVTTTPALSHPKVHLLHAAVNMTPPPMAKVVTVPGAPPLCGIKQTAPLPPKAHILQAVNHASVKTGVSTTPLGVALPQPANVPRDHAISQPELAPGKLLPGQHVPVAASPKAQALLVGSGAGAAAKGSPPLPLVQPPKAHHVIHGGPPPILTGAVASPPLKVPGSHPSSQQPVITGASSFRTAVPKQHVSGSLVTDLLPSSSQFVGSPPPAHQGEIVQHIGIPPHLRHDMAPSAAHYVHPQIMYQQYMPYNLTPTGVRSPHLVAMDTKLEPDLEEACRGSAACSPPLELRRPGSVGSGSGPAVGRTVALGLHSPHDRTTDSPQVATVYRLPAHCAAQPARFYAEEPPRAHVRGVARPPHHQPLPGTEAPSAQQRLQVATPPHASQVPPQADSLLMLLQRYPVMWQGLLALKNDQAAVQMHFVHGNVDIARESLRHHLNIAREDGSTPPLRIAQRMRLEQTQVEGVARKMQMGEEHCMLLALPCGRDHLDVLQQSNNLQTGFITYLQQKQAAGIVNIAVTGSTQPSFVMHIFPSCDFANDNLARIAPDLLHRVANLAHLLIVIATV